MRADEFKQAMADHAIAEDKRQTRRTIKIVSWTVIGTVLFVVLFRLAFVIVDLAT